MTDRVKVTITGYYDLPDDPALRERAFRTTDTAGCLAVDARTPARDLVAFCEHVEMRLELVPDPGGEEQ